MAMKDIGNTKDLRTFQHGSAEQGEPLCIVGKIAGSSAVEAVPIKEWRVFYEEKPYAWIPGPFHNRTKSVAIIKRDGNALNNRALIRYTREAVTRRKHTNLMASRGQRTRQSSNNVG
jgi:hypothetical protein